MTCNGFQRPLRMLYNEVRSAHEIPTFLAPAFRNVTATRTFSTSRPQSSRIGMAAITVPPDVSLQFYELPRSSTRGRNVDAATTAVDIKGPLGETTIGLPAYIYTKYDEPNKKITISVGNSEVKHQRAMWGTMRAQIQNTIAGVSEGHICILRLVGVGYRASLEDKAITKQAEYPGQQFVSLRLGHAHPIELPVPLGVKATIPQPTRILLEGIDKNVVTQFAADIRKWKKPEPYKGKGIFVNDETIKLKAKKIK